jgi:hypothetical protein
MPALPTRGVTGNGNRCDRAASKNQLWRDLSLGVRYCSPITTVHCRMAQSLTRPART